LEKIPKAKPGCVSSQDDTPGIFAEPWDYSDATTTIVLQGKEEEEWQGRMRALISALEKQKLSIQQGETLQSSQMFLFVW